MLSKIYIILIPLLFVFISCNKETIVQVPIKETGTLKIDSNPQGAKIYLQGTDTKKVTPDTLILQPDVYEITLKLTDYEAKTLSATVKNGLVTSLLVDLVYNKGTLIIQSTPDSASIWLNDINTNLITPDSLSSLEPGGYNIKILKEGYLTFEKDINVVAGITTTLDATLKEDPSFWWSEYNTSNSGIASNTVTSLAFDQQNNLWVGCIKTTDNNDGGVAKFDGSNWTVYNVFNSPLTSLNVSSLIIDNLNTIWIGTGSYWDGQASVGGGLHKFDGLNWTVYDKSNSPLSTNEIYDLAVEQSGKIWIATLSSGGLYSFDGNTWQNYFAGKNIRTVSVDKNNNIWVSIERKTISNNNELWRFNGNIWEEIQVGLNNPLINSIGIGNQSDIWLGTNGEGLILYQDGSTQVFNLSSFSINSNSVSGYSKFNIENWFACNYHGDNGGAMKYKNGIWTSYTDSKDSPITNLFCVAVDNSGNKWFGGPEGLFKYSKKD